jgi:SP family general alpha glucoside:H+ symporter-like MFS transporter
MPFIIQWVWVVPLFIIVFFSPDSPWWLVRQGRLEDAEKSVKRLTNPETFSDQDVKNSVAMMQHTTELEIENSKGATYIDCFRGVDRRRTEIVMMVFASQLLSGQNLIGQGVQFLQTAGISTNLSFSLSKFLTYFASRHHADRPDMVLNSMFIIGTVISWGCESACVRIVEQC